MGWLERRARRKLMYEQTRHPRYMGLFGRYPTMSLVRIGYLIDWLDSHTGHERELDDQVLARIWDNRSIVLEAFVDRDDTPLAFDRSSLLVIACVLSGRMPRFDRPVPALFLGPGCAWDHQAEYQSQYHAEVASHLMDDELPAARPTYEALLRFDPLCLSALANLAELERRAGRPEPAIRLLHQTLAQARAGGSRHGVANGQWWLHIVCALARLGDTETDLDRAALAAVQGGSPHAIGARLRELGPPSQVSIAAHAAFARLDAERRILLHAAMLVARIWPSPPPAAHDDFTAESRVAMLARGADAEHTLDRVSMKTRPSEPPPADEDAT